MLKLKEFQKEGVAFLMKHRHALLADEMGLGKTAQAITAWSGLNAKRALVICPASVKLNWRDEIARWTLCTPVCEIISGSRTPISSTAQVVIINYDLIYRPIIFKQLVSSSFDVLVCDEAHYLKSMTSKRTQAILGKGGIASRAKYKWMLTGTPILNRPVELFPMLKVLARDHIKPYEEYNPFVYRFCGAFDNGFQIDVRGATHLQDLNKRLKGFMLRRLKKNVANELPNKTFQSITVPLTPKMKRVIEELEEWEYLGQSVSSNQELGSMAKVRRLIAVEKVGIGIRHIKDVVEVTGKIVVFAYHREVINQLEKKLADMKPVVIDGSKTMTQRQDAINRFISDPETRVFIGQITAAGQGIDGLQKVCSNMFFLEMSWVPGEVDQAIDRLHRFGQTDNILIQFLVVEDTIETAMAKSIARKRKIIAEILR